jgi:hypothetical protein
VESDLGDSECLSLNFFQGSEWRNENEWVEINCISVFELFLPCVAFSDV